MLSNIFQTFRNFFILPTTETRISGKRSREDSDDSEPGELAKRLCMMTESNMSSKHRTTSKLSKPSTSKTTGQDVEVVVERPPWSGERRICSPRRPGRRLTDPPGQTQSAGTAGRQVPIVVERDERQVPVVVERRPAGSNRETAAATFPATASAAGNGAAAAAAADSDADNDVVVIEQKKAKPVVNGKGSSRSDFVGVRSFRQMLETGRVAGRSSPLRRQQQHKPQRQQRSPKQQTLYDKLIGIAPAAKNIKRGISATLNCFRLDEKRRYQQLLADLTGAGHLHSTSMAGEASFRTRSILASTPMGGAPSALRRDRLDPAATSQLAQRVSLVDLVSTGSESSAADRRPTPAGQPPLTVALSGSEADSQPASVVVSDDDSVVVEKVVPAPPRKKTQLDEDISRHLKHFAELRESYAASERERRRRVTEEERRGAISRLNHAEWERQLAQRLRRQMRLTQRLALPAEPEEEEEEEEEEGLPELTAEMESVISAALRPTPPTELMAEAFNQRITRHDLQTLKSLNWLNDEVINFYMNMLMDRNKTNEKLPKIYCFNTFFYGKIVSQGHSSVKRWTRKVDIFSHDLLIIPVHLGMHWCLACVDLRHKLVRYFDSMLGNNNLGLDAILRYLRDEHADKKKQPLDTADWEAVNEKEIPQQMNGSDCGMFACKFADYLSRDARLAFTQEHMPYFRRRMVYEIVTKTLL